MRKVNGEDDSEVSEKWKNIDDDASESDEDDNVSCFLVWAKIICQIVSLVLRVLCREWHCLVFQT